MPLLGAAAGFGAAAAVLFALNQRYVGAWPAPEPFPIIARWLNLIVALLVVPLVAMLGAGLLTRSRLPVERRLQETRRCAGLVPAHRCPQNDLMSVYTSLLRRLGHQRWFAETARRLVPVDRWIVARTGGRWSAIGRHGLPALLLTTIGRKSGQPRTQPLLYTRDGDAFVVVGSNWGQQHQPAWSANLLANPEATVALDGTPIPVRGVLATDAERDRLWQLALDTWPAYRAYADRAGDRELRIFRLERR